MFSQLGGGVKVWMHKWTHGWYTAWYKHCPAFSERSMPVEYKVKIHALHKMPYVWKKKKPVMMGAFSITIDILWFPWGDDRTDHTNVYHISITIVSEHITCSKHFIRQVWYQSMRWVLLVVSFCIWENWGWELESDFPIFSYLLWLCISNRQLMKRFNQGQVYT